ncbi:MAG: amidase [Acidimicrobiia bacterium]|nr:amidase [Acidimicrobiia bacterium]
MTDTPWLGDACSLVDAYRAGERSPLEELELTLAAIEASGLNAISFLDTDRAREAAAEADVDRPFGGVPVGVKELDSVQGWPDTAACVALRDRVADHDATWVPRVREAGAVLFGMTTASEFGGVNLTRTNLNGATRNPWNLECTPGGSSGGAAAAVAGGLCTIGSGGDGGGSIRIPAGFCGLLGLKATYGRIPIGPNVTVAMMTAVLGPLARSVRDCARWFDVCNGFDRHDPYSLARVDGWEAALGTHDLRGGRVAIVPDLGVAEVDPEVAGIVVEAGEWLAKQAGLETVDVDIHLPELSLEWALSGLPSVLRELGDRYPDCEGDLTPEIRLGLMAVKNMYSLESRMRVEANRAEMNEAMARIFENVDFVISSTNPAVAFAAEGPLPFEFNGKPVGPGNNGALTIPSNIYGNPAISIPAGTSEGLPVGLQVIGPHFSEPLLLDLALVVENGRPWPLVAPGAPL